VRAGGDTSNKRYSLGCEPIRRGRFEFMVFTGSQDGPDEIAALAGMLVDMAARRGRAKAETICGRARAWRSTPFQTFIARSVVTAASSPLLPSAVDL
jgi:hypothetical protein